MKKLFLLLTAVIPLVALQSRADFVPGRERAYASLKLDILSTQGWYLNTPKPVVVELMKMDGSPLISAFTVTYGNQSAPERYNVTSVGRNAQGAMVYSGEWVKPPEMSNDVVKIGSVTVPTMGGDYVVSVSAWLNNTVMGRLDGSAAPDFYILTQ